MTAETESKKQKEKDKENYLKSVQMNPGNENGMKVLKDLGVSTDNLVKKVPLEMLKHLEGDYLIMNPQSESDKHWTNSFRVEKGALTGNDGGYRYKLVPVGENSFVNPDDGATLIFDTKNAKEITVTIFGRFKFRRT